MEVVDKVRYPFGRLIIFDDITKEMIGRWKITIRDLPVKLKDLLNETDPGFENSRYREGGWTVRQLIHHIADSHINAYIRFKLALTEDTPTIKPYLEDKWAELPDTMNTPIKYSVNIIEGIHARWFELLKSMTEDDFSRELYHPEQRRNLSLGQLTGMYDWHSRHHSEHLRIAMDNHKRGISL